MPTDIAPALGRSAAFLQAGPGVSPGYDAIDLRRFLSVGEQERPVGSGAFKVSQRGAGANMSVDIAANVVSGALVQGDSVTGQGLYFVPPHTVVINEPITAAHATLPRLDQVVLEILDDTHAGGGLNKARIRVVDGTPTSGATLDNRTGAAALPASCMRLADYLVPALDTAITNDQIRDRRPGAPSIIATEESRASTAYGTLTTPDQVDVVLSQDGLLEVGYDALIKSSVLGGGSASLFLGANQVKFRDASAGLTNVEAFTNLTNTYEGIVTNDAGLATLAGGSGVSAVTTGQVIGGFFGGEASRGAYAVIFAAAGTYTVSVRFKAASGSVTAKERKLWVRAVAF